jgi:hypothetical protein
MASALHPARDPWDGGSRPGSPRQRVTGAYALARPLDNARAPGPGGREPAGGADYAGTLRRRPAAASRASPPAGTTPGTPSNASDLGAASTPAHTPTATSVDHDPAARQRRRALLTGSLRRRQVDHDQAAADAHQALPLLRRRISAQPTQRYAHLDDLGSPNRAELQPRSCTSTQTSEDGWLSLPARSNARVE